MTIKKKSTRSQNCSNLDIQDAINRVISLGGKTTADSEHENDILSNCNEKNVRFTLRLPSSLLKKVDEFRKMRIGIVSRNQWILEIISKATIDDSIA